MLGNIKQPPLTPKLSTACAGVDLTLPTMTSHGAYMLYIDEIRREPKSPEDFRASTRFRIQKTLRETRVAMETAESGGQHLDTQERVMFYIYRSPTPRPLAASWFIISLTHCVRVLLAIYICHI